jgi:tetratricopeptide (TPR) repeat protein
MRDAAGSKTDENTTAGNDRFGQVMALLMASLAILAAGLAFLETDARSRSATASRQARRFATEALGRRSSGEAQVGYGLYSAQAWYELEMLAHSAEQSYDAVAVQRYQTARDRLAELSPFLADYSADLPRYEVETYLVEATELSERAATAMVQEDAWDAKANAYLTHLALLAVALTLYGLAMVFSGRPRWAFVVTASGVVALIVVWAGLVFGGPVTGLPDAAIAHYARGVGLAYQGEAQPAIAAFDEALLAAPQYANALYERGNAHYALLDYEAAVADYEGARAAGRDDLSVAWNLGWTYYLLGRFDEAAAVDRHAIALSPDQLATRLNLGLALLASGQGPEARTEYAAAMDLAAQQVAQAQSVGLELPFSFWYYLDMGARDLESLLSRVYGQVYPWMEAPPREAVAQAQALGQASDLAVQLKEMSVSLEQTGRPAGGTGTALLTAFHFAPPEFQGGGGLGPAEPRTPFETGVLPTADVQTFFPESSVAGATRQRSWSLEEDWVVYTDTFPYGLKAVGIEFDYQGMEEGETVLWKVYRNGLEDRSLRWVETWSLGPAGEARKDLPFVFGGAGFYQVEMYVDGHLAQRGSFTLEPPAASESPPPVLFADDFDDSASGNWPITTAETFTTEYVEGSYRLYVGQGGLYVRSTLQEEAYSDVRIEVDAHKRLGTPDVNTFGLLCRFQDAEGWNGYMFLISGDGRYGIGKWQQGDLTWLREMRPSTAIRQGTASNHIRAECDSGMLSLYVNGEWLTGVRDQDLGSGQIGFVVGADLESRGADAYFDNLVLMEP